MAILSTERDARVPLFERLGDAAPGQRQEQPPLRMLDAGGLRASVARELARMMNVRSATGGRNAVLSVVDYGLPDWSALSAANPFDREQIARGMVRAVRAFEPRLCQPRVTVLATQRGPQSLQLRLAGTLAGDGTPVAFGIELGELGASVTIEQAG